MKFKYKWLIIVFLASLLIGCKTNTTNKIIELTKKDEIEKIDDGFIFFSANDCPLCTEVYPLVKREIKYNNIKMYHFNISDMLEKNIYTSDELLKLFNDSYNIITVPTIIKLDKGKEIARFSTDGEEMNDLAVKLNQFLEVNPDETR